MVFGIDEVGRGCWAGPLVLSAVSLARPIVGMKDSKRLSNKERERFASEIKDSGAVVYVAEIPAAKVDALGLSRAMQSAVEQLFSHISKLPYSKIIIDGNINYLSGKPNTEAVVKADDIIEECKAASIIAKVHRDQYMYNLHEKFPVYGFSNHVGYGTAAHAAAIEEHGLIDEHRRSFKPIQRYATG